MCVCMYPNEKKRGCGLPYFTHAVCMYSVLWSSREVALNVSSKMACVFFLETEKSKSKSWVLSLNL